MVYLKIQWLKFLGFLAKHSDCLAYKFGLIGIMRAEVQSGEFLGVPLGVALAIKDARGY